ncbi:MAG TPA: ribosomal-processing cysteine protease Prp [Candidatus Aquilonibacter sp.]|nr:ribosomal-processing cysteine protease Prp [Candidatus Aquilonibacter sp.]
MLTVTFYEDSRHRLSSFVGSGHVAIPETSSDEYSLVCAAVSAILQAARLGLEEVAHVTLDLHQERGDMHIGVPADRRDEPGIAAILATAALSVEQIARQYPQHVRFSRELEAQP